MSILRKIQQLCALQGINPSILEIKLGFGKGSLYKWDKSNPSIDKVVKVADYFRVPVDYLLERDLLNFDIGEHIRKERESQGITAKKLVEQIGIDEKELLDYETDKEPISEYIANRIMQVFDMSFFTFLNKYGLYDESIPYEFGGDVDQYEAFKVAEKEDAKKSNLAAYIKTLAASRADGYNKPLTPDEEVAVKAFLEAFRKSEK